MFYPAYSKPAFCVTSLHMTLKESKVVIMLSIQTTVPYEVIREVFFRFAKGETEAMECFVPSHRREHQQATISFLFLFLSSPGKGGLLEQNH